MRLRLDADTPCDAWYQAGQRKGRHRESERWRPRLYRTSLGTEGVEQDVEELPRWEPDNKKKEGLMTTKGTS